MLRINWVEIGALDLERAASFYEQALFIPSTPAVVDGEEHRVLHLSGNLGGILYKSDEIKSSTLFYFHVDRMDEVLERVKYCKGEVEMGKTLLKSYGEHDATIGPTLFDGKTGYISKIKDTEGNLIGLHANA